MHEPDDDDAFPPGPHDEEQQPPVEVPFDALSDAALNGVIHAFVLREGTDYGAQETSHEAKTAQVKRQILRGETVIVFDPNTQSVTLMTRAQWQKASAAK